ncbi:TetR/AcrR family transcriptional regulator [Kribbella sp. CA-293567]|uniref:TetR/AcrR family transcriptional regulator n=1 Tax=Kribbella sp. CA-293567 TaxID=3002436 RepID=UPI0022DE9643|nr:helix-turn-helix domain-containing protein [Kribbella sp. CA-293567]WBQ06139.1 helix-turn-helix domain containing protein [Kribbella sp. CA-293567]
MTKTLTPKGAATKQRIVAGAAELLRAQSVAATTLDDVCAHTHTSKSQLFHYFPEGKDQLLLAVAQYEADQVLSDQQPQLSNLDSWEAWQEWRDVVIERYRSLGDNCPMGALFLQVGRDTPGARAIVRRLLEDWQRFLAAGIEALQANGQLGPVDVEQTSAALLAGVQGGVTIMLSTGDTNYLEAAIDQGIERLRLAGSGSGRP